MSAPRRPTIRVVEDVPSGLDVVRIVPVVAAPAAPAAAPTPRPLGLPEAEAAELAATLQRAGMRGRAGQAFLLPRADGAWLALGLDGGQRDDATALRRAAATAWKALAGTRWTSAALVVADLPGAATAAAHASWWAAAVWAAAYRMPRPDRPDDDDVAPELVLVAPPDASAAVRAALERAAIVAHATERTRDWTNAPANAWTPAIWAEAAEAAGRAAGVAVTVLDEPAIAARGMAALLAVAGGSSQPPRVIVAHYEGDPEHPQRRLGLIGKGVTYDSGGLSIKPTASMASMATDMAGGAAVLNAAFAAARLGLRLNVVAVVAACENMIGGSAYRPGDIIGSMAGKTIEIDNTDAEGRLTLADAIHLAIEEYGVERIVDVATLTGAAVVGLGHVATAALSDDDDLWGALEAAADGSGERVWRLPAWPEYRPQLESQVADLKNTGGRPAGTITAGLFVREFCGGRPWLHLDVAGTARAAKAGDHGPAGATGVPTATLIGLLEQLSGS